MEPGLTTLLKAKSPPRRRKRPANRKKLTKRAIDAAKYEPPASHPRGAYYIWDTEISGFGLRVYPLDARSSC